MCGRRTAYADFLLGYARERHMAARVDFIYELSPEDLPALFRLARTFVYLPDAEIEASIVPVVEALRAGLPMVLSDTRLNSAKRLETLPFTSILKRWGRSPRHWKTYAGTRPSAAKCAGAKAAAPSFFRIRRRPPSDRHLQFVVKRAAGPKRDRYSEKNTIKGLVLN